MAKRRNKRAERTIAQERIAVLMDLAERSALQDMLERSDRYVDLARRIGMRHNVPLGSVYRRRICDRCHGYLHPGVTARVRLAKGKVTVHCQRCGAHSRFPYVREKRGLAKDGR